MGEDTLDWDRAPENWNWAAQDADGKWYWYCTVPVIGVGGGVWRSNSRNQLFAQQGSPNPLWHESLCQRPQDTTRSAKAQ
ncbi:hypothetical protein L1889_02900 [Paenalcaligenes niemegkensis]|uniref:hypothetical protein n=1 Tax=Paenalcaligenes niemegkensis TaxID=2895469 RepID=UPI001EE83536|nr:hypothetical protein [Paenalcaligenes niemegkensis]MCQ9615794.1 hypothetical protein [Paenalcaligenes niemegkensis]